MMFNKVLGVLTVLLFVSAPQAFAQLNVGYMNVQEVMSEIPERENVEQDLNDFVSEREQRFQERATEFQGAVADFQENQSSMSEDERAEREEELSMREQELTTYQDSLRQEINEHRQELLEPLYERVDVAIATVAEDLGLDFVINEQTSQGEEVIYFAGNEDLDITDRVLEQLNN